MGFFLCIIPDKIFNFVHVRVVQMVRNVTRSPPVGRMGVTVIVIVMAREGKGMQPNWVTSNEATGELRD